MLRTLSCVFTLGASLAGCSSSPNSRPDGDGGTDADASVEPRGMQDIPLTVNRDVDILFLIDDSPSMGDKQANVAANLPGFVEALAAQPGGLPNLHIGVVTPDLGTKGAGDAMPGPAIGTLGRGGCSMRGKAGAMQLSGLPVGSGSFLVDLAQPDGTRLTNYSGSLPEALSVMVKAGATGCGFEQPLEAIKQALLPSNLANLGFLRSEAVLAVVIVTDEDDCSMEHSTLLGNTTVDVARLGALQSFRCTRFGITCDDNGETPDAMTALGPKGRCHPSESSPYLTRVRDYAAFLKGLKADPSRITVAGLMGTTSPVETELRRIDGSTDTTLVPALAHSCSYVGVSGKSETADPPIRLRAFLDEFSSRSTSSSLCQLDVSGGLQQVADGIIAASNSACLRDRLFDAAPDEPGLQHDCVISAVTGQGTPAVALPRCTPEDATAGNQPCWHLVEDTARCRTADHLAVVLEGGAALAAETHLTLDCRIASAR